MNWTAALPRSQRLSGAWRREAPLAILRPTVRAFGRLKLERHASMIRTSSARIPAYLLAALAIYCAASLIHFIHNAEYLSDYPNLPAWLSRAKVYLAWLAISSVGATGLLLMSSGFRLAGLALIAGYAALGFAGLDHYSLAPASAHTLAMNATIVFEVTAAAVLLVMTIALLFHVSRRSAHD